MQYIEFSGTSSNEFIFDYKFIFTCSYKKVFKELNEGNFNPFWLEKDLTNFFGFMEKGSEDLIISCFIWSLASSFITLMSLDSWLFIIKRKYFFVFYFYISTN